jgi:hypothetical protein
MITPLWAAAHLLTRAEAPGIAVMPIDSTE